MKKIFLILAVLITATVSLKAQSSFLGTAVNPTGALLNASSDTLNYGLRISYRTVSIQPIVTKTSGTIAGTATLYYSVDGVNYVTTGSSLSLTDVAVNTTVWNISSAARYYRIITSGGTTLAAIVSAKVSAQ